MKKIILTSILGLFMILAITSVMAQTVTVPTLHATKVGPIAYLGIGLKGTSVFDTSPLVSKLTITAKDSLGNPFNMQLTINNERVVKSAGKYVVYGKAYGVYWTNTGLVSISWKPANYVVNTVLKTVSIELDGQPVVTNLKY